MQEEAHVASGQSREAEVYVWPEDPSPLAVLRAQGSSPAAAALVRLEQRLESDQRATQRQSQRLERRVEELANANGRWAELQGHVDGLSETLQGVVQQLEDRDVPKRTDTEALDGCACSSLRAELLQLAARVERAEAAADAFKHAPGALSSGDVQSRIEELECRFSQVDRRLITAAEDLCGTSTTLLVPHERHGEAPRFEEVFDEIGGVAGRLHALEHAFEDLAAAVSTGFRHPVARDHSWESQRSLRDGSAEAPSQFSLTSCDGRDNQEVVPSCPGSARNQDGEIHRQMDDLRRSFDRQLADFCGRMQEAERHIREAHDEHTEAMRNDAQHWQTQNDEADALQDEVNEIGERIMGVQGRLCDSERSLEGIAEAFDRVCQELTSLRIRLDHAEGDGIAQRALEEVLQLKQSLAPALLEVGVSQPDSDAAQEADRLADGDRRFPEAGGIAQRALEEVLQLKRSLALALLEVGASQPDSDAAQEADRLTDGDRQVRDTAESFTMASARAQLLTLQSQVSCLQQQVREMEASVDMVQRMPMLEERQGLFHKWHEELTARLGELQLPNMQEDVRELMQRQSTYEDRLQDAEGGLEALADTHGRMGDLNEQFVGLQAQMAELHEELPHREQMASAGREPAGSETDDDATQQLLLVWSRLQGVEAQIDALHSAQHESTEREACAREPKTPPHLQSFPRLGSDLAAPQSWTSLVSAPLRALPALEQISASAPCSARGASDFVARSSLQAVRARTEGRLLDAALRLQAQAETLGTPSTGLDARCAPNDLQDELQRLARELDQVLLSNSRRVNMEAHRTEAVAAMDARVAAVSDRLTDICARMHEAEHGLELAGRGSVAIRLRFEQLRSNLEARLVSLATDVADISARQMATERGVLAAGVAQALPPSYAKRCFGDPPAILAPT